MYAYADMLIVKTLVTDSLNGFAPGHTQNAEQKGYDHATVFQHS